MTKAYRDLVTAAFVLTLVVVVLGAWVRLTDAGLGCPDWPGCYGELVVTDAAHDTGKAWREMIHRYAAGALGFLIFAIAALAWRRRRVPGHPVKVPLTVAVLIVFQALLGMWTVTLLLKPVVVMGHLLGGMTVLALLWWLTLRGTGVPTVTMSPGVRRTATAALVVVAGQIALGGWTSANYAALACPDFPTCQTEWWPDADFAEGFVLWRGLGTNYEGGVLDLDARTAIHFAHRIGALVTFLFVGAVATAMFLRSGARPVRIAAGSVGAALLAQLTIGVLTVVEGIPLSLAVMHNAGAAVLLLSVVALNYVVRGPSIRAA